MAFSNGYIFGFAGTICVVCSLLVSSAAVNLKPIQDLNKERDRKANILVALGLAEEGQKLPGEEVDSLWDDRVSVKVIKADGSDADASSDMNGDGAVDIVDAELARAAAKGTGETPDLLAVYLRMDDGKVASTAIPVFGAGLWGPISGFLALDESLETISGVTFFAPKETPGLGAEITSPKFKADWVNESIVNADGDFVAISVAKGAVADKSADDTDHMVDGVSGATITCRGVTAMVEDGINNYDAYLAMNRN
ncbi:MAG: NADH:ubiquinone reductase (Na(+)-transporting) subunit C [Myxococcota bacterium]